MWPYTADELMIGAAFQIAIVAALVAWGRWVARRMGNGVWWRRLAMLPWVAFVLGTLGVALTIWMLIRSFESLVNSDPSSKAHRLAEGISSAMNVGAPLLLLSLVGYFVAILAFVIGSLRRQPS